MQSLNLNDRQVKAVLFTKKKGKLTNSDYQTLNDVSRETATRDLKQLIDKQLINKCICIFNVIYKFYYDFISEKCPRW